MQQYVAAKSPSQTLQAIYEAGKQKVAVKWDVLIIQSFMAGIYVGIGGQISCTVAGGMGAATVAANPGLQKFIFGALFPVALFAIVFTGSELFTGDAMILVVSYLGGKITLKQLLRNWSVAWVFNFVGCVTWAYFLGHLTELFEADPYHSFVIKVAEKKAGLHWHVAFLRGIGANFMVCLAVWQAITSSDVTGKILAMWWPVMAFAANGFEHSIADMYIVSLGCMLGADVTAKQFLIDLLIPVSLGNVFGGSILMGVVYWWVFDRMHAVESVHRSLWNIHHRGETQKTESQKGHHEGHFQFHFHRSVKHTTHTDDDTAHHVVEMGHSRTVPMANDKSSVPV